ncbi:MAG: PQQ-dependent sugar dehydrogenase [Proteobacteria bacterium]|nr:PQQ-dependent sugar dehydrogenase [Pseudomonadota bacterium]
MLAAGLLPALLQWKFHELPWHLSRRDWHGSAILLAAYGLSALVAVGLARAYGRRAVGMVVVATMAAFSLALLFFLERQTGFSRSITAIAFGGALILVPVPLLLSGTRRVALVTLALLALAVLTALILSRPRHEPPSPAYEARYQHSAYYGLNVETFADAFPHSLVRGGALAVVGSHYLLAAGDGHLYTFDLPEAGGPVSFRPLPYRVPINGDAFARVSGRPWGVAVNDGPPAEGARTNGPEVLHNEWFRVYGLMVEERGQSLRLLSSHVYWHDAQRCWTERISVLEADREALLAGRAHADWHTLFETRPCLPIEGESRRHGIPFVGYFGGGRLLHFDDRHVLFAVGEFGFDGVAAPAAFSQDPAVSYGKTLLIDVTDGSSQIYTLGHRNPEGLFIDPDGSIWLTEHGPQGGDALQRLRRGGNYGWPYATYGTDYGAFRWPLSQHEGEYDGYQAPIFAWVPSIGVSNVLVVHGELFPLWRGDLLIASLKARTLFRTRVRDGRVAYLEAIEIGSRIRDISEAPDGRIVLLTDDDTIVTLRPNAGSTGESLFADHCSGCHQSALFSGNRIGPNLYDVVDRPVATLEGYTDYSPGLRALGGTWTAERLDRFMTDPRAFCPGTSMEFPGVPDAKQRAAIVAYLQTLHP